MQLPIKMNVKIHHITFIVGALGTLYSGTEYIPKIRLVPNYPNNKTCTSMYHQTESKTQYQCNIQNNQ